MKSTPQIFRWLDGVKADRRLCASSVFKIAYQLSNRTNAAEFKKTGRLTTWQSVPTLAGATGLSVRTVRYAIRQLQTAGHLAVKIGYGRGQSNRYTLTPKTPVAAFNEAKTCNPLQPFDQENLQPGVLKAAKNDAKTCNQLPPNLSIKEFSNLSSANSATKPGAPRLRAVALSAPPETGKGLGNGSGPAAQAEPLRPARPHADLEDKIRSALGDHSKLFAGARVTEADAQSILIGCLTDHHASELRPFVDDIQAATGAEQVRFTVALGPGLKKRGGAP